MKTHKNYLWICLLAATGSAALFYSVLFGFHMRGYSRLRASVVPKEAVWSVGKLNSEMYAPKLTYSFDYKGIKYSGADLAAEEIYRNPSVLRKKLPDYEKKGLRIWFDPARPTHSAWRKSFPVRSGLRAFTTVAIFIYFLFLGSYAVDRNKGRE